MQQQQPAAMTVHTTNSPRESINDLFAKLRPDQVQRFYSLIEIFPSENDKLSGKAYISVLQECINTLDTHINRLDHWFLDSGVSHHVTGN